MRETTYIWKILKITFSICLFFMLLALMYQTNNYEKRVINLEKKIDRLLATGFTPTYTDTTKGKEIELKTEQRKYLHPELPNLLENGTFYSSRPQAS